jgi:hypothetical protein
MSPSQGQCRQVGSGEGGKFCRSGIICRDLDATIMAKAVVLSTFLPWHAAC